MYKFHGQYSLGLCMLSMVWGTAIAQNNYLSGQVEPPAEVIVSPQQWLAHQDWFCPPKQTYDPNKYVESMRQRMNVLGAAGWEVVGFSQVNVAAVNAGCYVVTYKAPRKK